MPQKRLFEKAKFSAELDTHNQKKHTSRPRPPPCLLLVECIFFLFLSWPSHKNSKDFWDGGPTTSTCLQGLV
jgi:hypothetical protein